MKKRRLWMMVTAGFLGCYLCLMGILTLYVRREVVDQAWNRWNELAVKLAEAVSEARESSEGKEGSPEILKWRLNTWLADQEFENLFDNPYVPGQRSQALVFAGDGTLYAGGTEYFAPKIAWSELFQTYVSADEWESLTGNSVDPVMANDFDGTFWDNILPWVKKYAEAHMQNGYKEETGNNITYSFFANTERYRYKDTIYGVLKELSVMENTWKTLEEDEKTEDYPFVKEAYKIVWADGSTTQGCQYNQIQNFRPDGTVQTEVLTDRREVYHWENQESYEGELLEKEAVRIQEDGTVGLASVLNPDNVFFAPYLISHFTPKPVGWMTYEEWKTDPFLQGTEFQDALKESYEENGEMDIAEFMASPLYRQGGQKKGFFRVEMYRTDPVSYVDQTLLIRSATVFEPVKEAVRRLKTVYGYSFLVTLLSGLLVGILLHRLETKKAYLEQNRRDLTNAMAHEMKMPLAVIRNFSENAMEEEEVEKRQRYLSLVVQKTEEMDEMVKRIVTVSELDGERTLGLSEDVRLDKILEEELEKFRLLIEEKQLTLTVNVVPVTLYASGKLFSQVIYNLLSNAVSYTPPGGAMSVTLSPSSFTVENTGSHIDEDELEKIWEPFYRRSEEQERGHMGLGLYLIRRITGQYGLSSRGENTLEGVRFTVSLRRKHQ